MPRVNIYKIISIVITMMLLFVVNLAFSMTAEKELDNMGKHDLKPIVLHPDNPHYFLFRGKPVILITSGEHYGAVLNLDFDYVKYLDALHSYGLNLTRLFSGVYCESPASFNIQNNTLAPAPLRYIVPWARSSVPGYANGGNKFDLSRWDESYFRRLKDFVHQAGLRGIVVEVVLFCPYYGDEQWDLSPININNNVNGIGDLARTDALTMKSGEMVAIHDAMVRKIVDELRDFDNFYYEICNEPYFGGVTIEWQYHIASIITDAESSFPHKHLIAQNIANGSAKIDDPHKDVSIFNFHYATPPVTVEMNYGLNRVIADDETGFRGTEDMPYRTEGWEFVIAGGGAYSNLDYSYTVRHEDGTFDLPKSQPGGGGKSLQKQLKILKDFIHTFDFIRMTPNNQLIKSELPEGTTARVLAEIGKAYAIYIKGGAEVELTLDLPEGKYRAEWLNTITGMKDKEQNITHSGGSISLSSPEYMEDIALKVVKAKTDN